MHAEFQRPILACEGLTKRPHRDWYSNKETSDATNQCRIMVYAEKPESRRRQEAPNATDEAADNGSSPIVSPPDWKNVAYRHLSKSSPSHGDFVMRP